MSDTSKIKVQINSLEALQRFIGGNPELEIQVKESIVNQFTKQYLKECTEDALLKIRSEIKDEIRKTSYFGALEKVAKTTTFSSGLKLSDEFKKIIQKEVHDAINVEIKAMIQNEIGSIIMEARKQANIALQAVVDIVSERQINKMAEQKLMAMLQKVKS